MYQSSDLYLALFAGFSLLQKRDFHGILLLFISEKQCCSSFPRGE